MLSGKFCRWIFAQNYSMDKSLIWCVLPWRTYLYAISTSLFKMHAEQSMFCYPINIHGISDLSFTHFSLLINHYVIRKLSALCLLRSNRTWSSFVYQRSNLINRDYFTSLIFSYIMDWCACELLKLHYYLWRVRAILSNLHVQCRRTWLLVHSGTGPYVCYFADFLLRYILLVSVPKVFKHGNMFAVDLQQKCVKK